MPDQRRGGGQYHDYHDYHDYDKPAPEPYDSRQRRLREGGGLPYSSDSAGTNRYWVDTTASAVGLDYGRLSPPRREQKAPEYDIYAGQNSRRGRREMSPVADRHAPTDNAFDLNDSQQPNSWHGAEPNQPSQAETVHSPDRSPELEVRQFASCRDDHDLHDYLAARSISVCFLSEIDQFFKGHPEIDTYEEGRSTIHQINALPPLAAYRYFLKGYTRPARYVDGVIRTDAFTVPMNFTYQALSSKTDPELVEFFCGFDYRHDVIERIDKEVYTGIQALTSGRYLPVALRKLICYAVWGNPVDAYKWFEYSYQNEHMPYRYLPEHAVLGYVPKPADYKEPRPSMLTGDKKYGHVRACMAQAYDQGVDVLEVLVAEYRHALVRRGHQRSEIDDLVKKAKQRLEKERQDPKGVDIVDFIMDDAVTRRDNLLPLDPRARRTIHPGQYNLTSNAFRFVGGTITFTRGQARRPPGFLQAQAAELRRAKTSLFRLYNQEQYTAAKGGPNTVDTPLQMIRASRATAERRYVNCLIRYSRDANVMTSAQADDLQKDFTRGKMGKPGDMGSSNSNYLLGLYPRELD